MSRQTPASKTFGAVSADNGTPSTTEGLPVRENTEEAYISVAAAATVTNADINLWGRTKGTGVWKLIPGGSMDDLQDETGDEWTQEVQGVQAYDRLYVEVDNYAGTGNVEAFLTEVLG